MKIPSAILSLLTFLLTLTPGIFAHPADDNSEINPQQRLREHAQSLKRFAAEQAGNTDIGILIDMSVPSWKNRFFVVNLNNDSVLIAGLCAHGGGLHGLGEIVAFSNVPGSYLSSEGRYRIGEKYYGTFGMSYRLYGLDATNSRALERAIVLHALACVPDKEGTDLCLSKGCPMVSPKVLKRTSVLLDHASKPVMMWIYK